MKPFEELTRLEKTVLLIWGKQLKFSTNNHRQIEKINKRIDATLPVIPRKDKKRINKMLLSSGFIIRHPTGRSKTYCLSPDGLKCCNILKRENDI